MLCFRRDYQLWICYGAIVATLFFFFQVTCSWFFFWDSKAIRSWHHATKESSLWSRNKCQGVSRPSSWSEVLAGMKETTGRDPWMTHCSTYMQEMKYLVALPNRVNTTRGRSKSKYCWSGQLRNSVFIPKTPSRRLCESPGLQLHQPVTLIDWNGFTIFEWIMFLSIYI